MTPQALTRSIALFGALALFGGACGSDTAEDAEPLIVVESSTDAGQDDPDTAAQPDDSAAVSGTEEEQALAFADCMRNEGIDFPDPTVGADGSVDFGFGNGGGEGGEGEGGFGQDDGFREAVEVCGDLVDGASFLPTEGDFTEIEDTFLAAADCLRAEGIDVGDPEFGAGGPGAGGPFGADFDPEDPATAAAIEACDEVFTDLGQGRDN